MKMINQELLQIGEQVRIMRKKRGMGQEALAEAADVSNITISRIENGISAMSVLTLKRISEALEVPAEEILGKR